MFRGMNQCRLSIPHPTHVMALELQSLLQKQSKSRIIFNDQNSHIFLPRQKVLQVPQVTLPIWLCVITLVHPARDDKNSLQVFAHVSSKREFLQRIVIPS